MSWMRNSSYLTRRNNVKRKDAAENREEVAVDASEAAQLLMIEKTFLDVTSQELNQLEHPNPKKRHLKVVEVSSLESVEPLCNSPYYRVTTSCQMMKHGQTTTFFFDSLSDRPQRQQL